MGSKIRVYRVTLNNDGNMVEFDFLTSDDAMKFMESAYDHLEYPTYAVLTLTIKEREDNF